MFPNFRQSTCIFWVWVSGLILAETFWNMWNPILFLMYYIDYMRESIHSTFGGIAGVFYLTSITQVDTCAAQWKPSLDLVWWGRRHEERVRIIQYCSDVFAVFCIKSFLRILSFCPQYFLLFPCLAWYWESSPAPILCVGLPILCQAWIELWGGQKCCSGILFRGEGKHKLDLQPSLLSTCHTKFIQRN